MALTVAAEIDSQMLGGHFDLLHRPDPVSLVVMVRLREQPVSLPQQSRLRAVVGDLSPGCALAAAAGRTAFCALASPARLSEMNAAATHAAARRPVK